MNRQKIVTDSRVSFKITFCVEVCSIRYYINEVYIIIKIKYNEVIRLSPYTRESQMLSTEHRIVISDARDLRFIDDESVDIVVTSPPYPMIEMWDELFGMLNPEIAPALERDESRVAFELMHKELDRVWSGLLRVLKDGGFACINIGDATRTVAGRFRLYSNHSRITTYCTGIGFEALPVILWRKQTNAPNKFMGSGMLPAGAYVTLEHEYILIFRKGLKRSFGTDKEKDTRRESSYFWEERNRWFSDIWDFKGMRQDFQHQDLQVRSAAFPFELAYRLINMYSVKGDVVLDPFLGTGTTTRAAIASCRNSIGVEINDRYKSMLFEIIMNSTVTLNDYISRRLNAHRAFVDEYVSNNKQLKHRNAPYGFPVMTQQETGLVINYIRRVYCTDDTVVKAEYHKEPMIRDVRPVRRVLAEKRNAQSTQLKLEL